MIGATLFHFFFPHEANNQRAKLLHYSSLSVILVILVGFQLSFSAIKRLDPSILGVASDISTTRLLDQTNKKRQEVGLPSLNMSSELSQAAQAKATDMFTKNYWAHNSPDGHTPWDFILQSGYHYLYAGENLAKDFQESDAVVDAWIASPSHKSNILRPQYSEVGFAVVNGKLNGEKTTLVVQMFGTKAGSQVADQNLPQTVEPARGDVQGNPLTKIQGQNRELPNTIIGVSPKRQMFDFIFASRAISLLFAGLMFTVLITDGFFLWRRHIFRASGHNLAHLIFLGSLVGTIWFTSLGAIL